MKIFRYILLPFSLVYGGIIRMRNKLFDKNILRSATFDFPLICVGNLAVGGTGKTPMVEYLVNLLQQNYKVATLSRGYRRKTKGFLIADENSEASDLGDEPMQIHQKFPGISVAVAEERVMGIPQLLFNKPETQLIILDDAFQHRAVKAGLNILLTGYDNLYPKDFLLPTGNLRDLKNSSKRAHIIVVTKCKPDLNEDERESIIKELNPLKNQKIYFTKIIYKSPYHLFQKNIFPFDKELEVLLVCGIANPTVILETFESKVSSIKIMRYKDHYNFHSDDINNIKERFSKIKNEKKMILITEKDAAKLSIFVNDLNQVPIYVLPMEHKFLFGGENEFKNDVFNFVSSFTNK